MVGMLGYGFPEHEMYETLQRLKEDSIPTAMIVDSGSTDSGPSKLANGLMTLPRSAYERDLEWLLRGVMRYRIPLLIGSAGGAGTNDQVDSITDMVGNICQKQ